MNECRCKRSKHRTPEEQKALLNRLRRIEGQIRGLEKMLEEDACCTDILTQTGAAQSALSAFSRELLDSHIRTCVVTDIQNGDTQVVGDLVDTIHKLMK